ncbi:DUF1223 domain-containing protein [Aquabacter cavernae]|uniref:DUF1223 domain-containing protein n=1 Tax=Aquabacter cavernae TaxID=2496029 RepID=UPI000F8E0153|nr:DUF1223 domain-containing protein [Aquabacter cavernae]
MRVRLALLPLLALALLSGPAGAQQVSGTQAPTAATGSTNPKAIIELFTSQGCASCPPADALLGELAKDPDVLAITLAVDYWDYVGWKDTLAKHGHSVRQRAYAEQRGDRMIYTPQMIIDGQLPAKGSDKSAVLRAVARAKEPHFSLSVPVTLSRKDDQIVIDVGALPKHAPAGLAADIWVCPVIRSHEVSIGRGENAGKTVTYTNVVRGWIRLGPWTGQAATYSVPLDKVRMENEDGVVVMVQTGNPAAPGAILGASRLALD